MVTNVGFDEGHPFVEPGVNEGALGEDSGRFFVGYEENTWTPIRLLSESGDLRLLAPSSVGESIWYSRAGVLEGDYEGDWFDGFTGDTPDTSRYRWVGTPDASPSVYETRTRTGGNPGEYTAVISGPWIGGQGNSGCRFLGTPSYVSNSGVEGGRIGVAASFVEVGDWLYG